MPTPKPALEEWIPKAAAAKLLGVSLRQIERREKEGFIEKRTLDRLPTESTGRVVYSRTDLVALKAGTPNIHARVVQDVVQVPENGEIPNKPATDGQPGKLALMRVPDASGPSADFGLKPKEAAELCAVALGAYRVSLITRAWLTVDEAVEYSGLPRGYLLKRAREGWDAAVDVSTGGAHQFWRFNRAALGAGK